MKTLKDAKVGETVKATKLTGEGPVTVSYTHLDVYKRQEIPLRLW